MSSDCTELEKVKAIMKDHVDGMIEDFPQTLTWQKTSPAGDNLFKNEPSKILTKDKAECFHAFAAKSLFLTKRARPDMHHAVPHLCTPVKEPTQHD